MFACGAHILSLNYHSGLEFPLNIPVMRASWNDQCIRSSSALGMLTLQD